jgi:hypothetical protein
VALDAAICIPARVEYSLVRVLLRAGGGRGILPPPPNKPNVSRGGGRESAEARFLKRASRNDYCRDDTARKTG